MNLYAWSEYVPQEVLDGFTKETGIKVNYGTYDSNEKLLQSLLIDPSQYDLIQPSDYMVQTLIRLKKLEPIEPSSDSESEEHPARVPQSALRSRQ